MADFEVIFSDESRAHDVSFGEVSRVSDGGYERGYADGESAGYKNGVAKVEADNAVILDDCNTALTEKGVSTADTLADVPGQIGGIKPYSEGYTNGYADGYADGEGASNEFIKCAVSFDFRELEDETIEVSSESAKTYGVIPVLANGNNPYPNNGMLEGNKSIKACTALFPNATHGRRAFYDCTNLEYVKICADNLCDSGEVTACYGMFGNCTSLKTVDVVFDGTNCWFGSSAFDNCYSLVNVRFVPLTIKKTISLAKCYSLSNESIQSVIDGLADLTGGTAVRVSFHSDVIAKLTDTQINMIYLKNWMI